MAGYCNEPRCPNEATTVAHTRIGPIPVCHQHAEELAGRPLHTKEAPAVHG